MLTTILKEDLTDVEPKKSDKNNFLKTKVEPLIENSLYIIGIIVIVVGSIHSIIIGLRGRSKNKGYDLIMTEMRIQLSESFALALTFILGAEIVKTFRVPNLFQVIKVTLLVLLRQLITYFLDKEAEKLRRLLKDLHGNII